MKISEIIIPFPKNDIAALAEYSRLPDIFFIGGISYVIYELNGLDVGTYVARYNGDTLPQNGRRAVRGGIVRMEDQDWLERFLAYHGYNEPYIYFEGINRFIRRKQSGIYEEAKDSQSPVEQIT